MKGMPECHKKKVRFPVEKQVYKKAGAQEIQNFLRSRGRKQGMIIDALRLKLWGKSNGKIYSKIVQYAYMQYIYSESVKIEVSLCRGDRCRRNLLSLHA